MNRLCDPEPTIRQKEAASDNLTCNYNIQRLAGSTVIVKIYTIQDMGSIVVLSLCV